MKKFLFLAVCFLYSFSLWSMGIGGDLVSLDSFFMQGTRVDLSLSFSALDTKITFPIRYGKSNQYDLNYAETGVLVSVHPFEDWNFFVEASFLDVGWMWGLYAPEEPLVVSSEGAVGYDLKLGSFHLLPSLRVRNPLASDREKASTLSLIPQFSSVRFSLFCELEI